MREILKAIYERTDGNCHLCGKKHRLRDHAITWHREHHVPRSKGGSDSISNLYVACIACNQIKGTNPSRIVRRWMGLNRIPLSRNAKHKIRDEEEVNQNLWWLFLIFLAMFIWGLFSKKTQMTEPSSKLT